MGISMGTIVTTAVWAGIVALIVRGMIIDRKKGRSLQCGCDCKHCSGHCDL